jgi:hypothetical protein
MTEHTSPPAATREAAQRFRQLDNVTVEALLLVAAHAVAIARVTHADQRAAGANVVDVPWECVEGIRQACDRAGIHWRKGLVGGFFE